MAAERVDLTHQDGIRRVRRWRTGRLNTHTERYLTLGVLGDGRWFVELSGQRQAWVYPYERDASEKAEQILAKGEWQPIPAVYDAGGLPADGRTWVARGQTWELVED